MILSSLRKNRTAFALMEYAILIGVVTMAFMAMNTYIKRGVQGKVKDMTDFFIGKEQSVDSNPTAMIDSATESEYDSDADMSLLRGGGMRLVSLDSVRSRTRSKIVDAPEELVDTGTFVSAESMAIPIPAPVTDEDIAGLYDKKEEAAKITINILKSKKERLLAEAESLEAAAGHIEDSGWQAWDGVRRTIRQSEVAKVWLVSIINKWNPIRTAAALFAVAWGLKLDNKYLKGDVGEIWKLAAGGGGCDRKECVEAGIDVYNKGKEMFQQAAGERAKAGLKRAEAQSVQEQIDRMSAAIAAGGGS